MAGQLWAQLGVPVVTDWFVLRGDEPAYYLVTPEDEISLGARLLDYPTIRHRLMDGLRVLAPSAKDLLKTGPSWDERALLLRKLAREEEVEPTRASERLSQWVDAYREQYHPTECPVDERRDRLTVSPMLVDGRLCLRPAHLMRFIDGSLGDKLSASELRALLKRAGWHSGHVAIDGGTMRCWKESDT